MIVCIVHVVILHSFVGRNAVESALLWEKLLTQQDVKRNIEEISSTCLNENIDINRIKKYFTQETWLLVIKKN